MHLTVWVRRYGVAEIVGLGTAITSALAGLALTGSEIAAAFAGALGESVGYYGAMITRDLLADDGAADQLRRPHGPRDIYRIAARLLVEFGPAEVADLVIRPFTMGVGIHLFGFEWGVLAGKLMADLVFYVPVVSAYELRCYLTRAHADR
jgi:hypothetical protein